MISGCVLLSPMAKRLRGLFFLGSLFSSQPPRGFISNPICYSTCPIAETERVLTRMAFLISSLQSGASLTQWSLALSLWSSPGSRVGQLSSFHPLFAPLFRLPSRYNKSVFFFPRCFFFPFLSISFDGDPHRTVNGDGRLWCAGDSPTRKGVAVLHKEPAEYWRQTHEAEELPRLVQRSVRRQLLLSARGLVFPPIWAAHTENWTISAVSGESVDLVVPVHARDPSKDHRCTLFITLEIKKMWCLDVLNLDWFKAKGL